MKKNNILKYLSLILMFVGLCFVKLWYVLPVYFIFAIALTFFQKKRNYCSSLCPMGAVQDWLHEENDKKPSNQKHPKKISWLRALFFFIFWGYFAVVLFVFHDSPGNIWYWLVRLTIFSMITAMILQQFVRKRYWCTHLCPLGTVLDKVGRK